MGRGGAETKTTIAIAPRLRERDTVTERFLTCLISCPRASWPRLRASCPPPLFWRRPPPVPPQPRALRPVLPAPRRVPPLRRVLLPPLPRLALRSLLPSRW